MISNKFLRFVNIIFLGSVLLYRVKADCVITYADNECTASGCTAGYYAVFSSDGSTYTFAEDYSNTTGATSGILLLVSTSGTTTCSKVISGSGYFKNGDNYFSRDNAGAVTKVTPESNCTADEIGKLATDSSDSNMTKLCIAAGIFVNFSATTDKYLIGVTSGVTTVFSAETTTTNGLVIEASASSITFSSSYSTASGEKDYFDSATLKKVNDLSGCSATLLPNNYSCTSGVCTPTALTLADSTDYLLLVDSTTNIYCKVTKTSGNNVISAISTATVTVDTTAANVIGSILYPVLTDLTTFTSAIPSNILTYGCASNVCTAKDVYILYGTGGASLALCTAAGTCSEVTADGYYINISHSSTPYVKCTGGTCTASAAPANTVTCSADTIGQLVDNNSTVNLCLAAGTSVPFVAAGAAAKKYLVSYHDDSAFTSVDSAVKYGVVTVTSDAITLDAETDAAICVKTADLTVTPKGSSACASGTTEYTHCTDGVCYNDCIGKTGANCLADTYYMFSDAEGQTYQSSETTAGYLFYCAEDTENNNAIKCDKITSVGYHGIGTNDAYKCTKSGTYIKCVKEAIPTTDCTSSTIGKLGTKNGNTVICLGVSGDNVISAELAAAANYILSGNSVLGVTANTYAIVEVGTDSVVVQGDENTTGLVVAASATNALTTDTSTFSDAIYSCTQGVCTAVGTTQKIGYFKHAIPTTDYSYIQCKFDTDKIKCANYQPGSSCTKIGDLLNDSNKIKICFDTSDANKQVELVTANNGQYLISIGSSNIFGNKASNFVIVNLVDGDVVLGEKEAEPVKYQYANASSKIYTINELGSNLQCSAGQIPAGTTVTEYKLNTDDAQDTDTVNYYKDNTPTS